MRLRVIKSDRMIALYTANQLTLLRQLFNVIFMHFCT